MLKYLFFNNVKTSLKISLNYVPWIKDYWSLKLANEKYINSHIK